jgi:hypothetical protein
MKKFAMVTAALLLTASAAHAVPTTLISGGYSIGYTPAIGNAPTFSDDLSSSFTENLAVNSPTTVTNFFAVSPARTCGTCTSSKDHETASGTIAVTLTFKMVRSSISTS